MAANDDTPPAMSAPADGGFGDVAARHRPAEGVADRRRSVRTDAARPGPMPRGAGTIEAPC